jgi:hypothetical protein
VDVSYFSTPALQVSMFAHVSLAVNPSKRYRQKKTQRVSRLLTLAERAIRFPEIVKQGDWSVSLNMPRTCNFTCDVPWISVRLLLGEGA